MTHDERAARLAPVVPTHLEEDVLHLLEAQHAGLGVAHYGCSWTFAVMYFGRRFRH